MMKVLLGDESMSKINLSLFLLCSILAACVSSNSHFVRFWNGDVISDMTPEEEKKFDLCYEKTKNLPRGTAEERGKSSLATLKCMDDKK
ncbi:hypothetical protein [uncultured Haemophilus sp.]|uniref:hypothetical protein n=1 Tax=uncultured Haemophilus sp. TaxID=237779 RepID=UPI0025D212D0|nr:hypothetical protein [uncultured Haemophilus sp.]